MNSRQSSVAVAAAVAVVALPLLSRALRRVLLGPSTPLDFNLACACGKVKAAVHAPDPLSLVCHCDDCRDYVLWCGQHANPPCAPRGGDPGDGVRTCQVFKADIRVNEPAQLQWSVLDPSLVPPDRPFTLLRAHATCCNTPLFNTWRELPTCSFFAPAVVEDGGSGAASLLQPPQWRLNVQFAQKAPTVTASCGTAQLFGFRFLARFMARNLVYYRSRAVPAPFALPESLEACVVRQRAEATQ